MERNALRVAVVALFGIASCQGIQERLDVLRVKKIEIIDDDDRSKMNVETELRTLKERVAKLEADLAKMQSVPPPSPTPPPPPAPAASDAGARPAARTAKPPPGPPSGDLY